MPALQTVNAIFSPPSSPLSVRTLRLLPPRLSLRETRAENEREREREQGGWRGSGDGEEECVKERSRAEAKQEDREMERGERRMDEEEKGETTTVHAYCARLLMDTSIDTPRSHRESLRH